MRSALNQTWEEFIADLPAAKRSGVTIDTLTLSSAGIRVDALVYRMSGEIVGVLYHYPDGTPFEKPGSANLMVKPGYRRMRIGTTLATRAVMQFGLDLDAQTYTTDGADLRASIARSHARRSIGDIERRTT